MTARIVSLSGSATVGLARTVMLGVARVMTSRRILIDPPLPSEAFAHVRSWPDQPQVQIVHPGGRHLELVEQLIIAAGAAGELMTDAHLAAPAIELGAELHSNDADFARFPGLRWHNPLGTER